MSNKWFDSLSKDDQIFVCKILLKIIKEALLKQNPNCLDFSYKYTTRNDDFIKKINYSYGAFKPEYSFGNPLFISFPIYTYGA